MGHFNKYHPLAPSRLDDVVAVLCGSHSGA
jgi:hypothetical protein